MLGIGAIGATLTLSAGALGLVVTVVLSVVVVVDAFGADSVVELRGLLELAACRDDFVLVEVVTVTSFSFAGPLGLADAAACGCGSVEALDGVLAAARVVGALVSAVVLVVVSGAPVFALAAVAVRGLAISWFAVVRSSTTAPPIATAVIVANAMPK